MQKLNVHLVKLCLKVYHYRFIVHFLMGLDFLFITFPLHLFLSLTSSLSISSFSISASTLSNHVLFGLPTDLLPTTPNSIHFFHTVFSTCPYHLSLPLLMTVTSLHPPLGYQLDQLPGLFRHITTPETVGYPRQVTTHTTAPLVNPFLYTVH